jgi:hypothetical protein
MRLRTWLVVATVVGALAVSSVSATAVDQKPTSIAAQAKTLGITKAGQKYRYEHETATSPEGTLILTVDLPTAWSDRADSHFVHPDSGEPYGAGVRATTDADKFHSSFAVPGLKVNATTEIPASFDAGELVRANAFKGCRASSVKPFDNGTVAGSYQLFSKCDRKKAAAVVVVGVDERAGVELLVAGQALTKADLRAFDRALRTAGVEKTSV